MCWSATVGLGFVDPIRSEDFQTRHLLMALKAGERRRIARALVVEIIFLATLGYRRARRLSDLTCKLAFAEDDPYLRALSFLAQSFIDYYLDNRWRRALDRLDEAEELLRTCGGSWALDTVQLWRCFTQIYLGQLVDLAHLVPGYARAAERRGDLYMAVTVRTRANLVWLVRDDVIGAREELDWAKRSWMEAHDGYHLQHLFALFAGCEIALYSGQVMAAEELMKRAVPSLRRSLIARLPMVKLEITVLQVRIALALAGSEQGRSEGQRHLRQARKHLKRLARIRLPLTRGLVPAYQASLAVLEGDLDTAQAHLRHAAAILEQLETMLYATAVKRRLATLIGGDAGATLLAEADQWMKDQGVRSSERMTNMLIPDSSPAAVAR